MWKVICATMVIFITGVVTGGLLVSYADRASQKSRASRPRTEVRPAANLPNPAPTANPRDPSRLPNPANRPRSGINLEFLQKLDAEVHLSAEQRERIEQIINEGQLRNKEIWDRVAPDVRRENVETQRRIRETLTPEQLTRFEELMKQNRPPGRRAEESVPPNFRPKDLRRPSPSTNAAPDSPQPAPANP